MHPFVNTAIKAARAAGDLMLRAQTRLGDITVTEKTGPNNLVTEVDHACEKTIVNTLHEAYPDHSVIAEEGTQIEGENYTWIIDPLDGTLNFSHGFPHFCVSIACLFKGRVEHAVIYNPCQNDLFTATRGQGAQKNNQRIRVSKHVKLAGSIIANGLHATATELRKNYIDCLSALQDEKSTMRRTGSAALDLAYTASGQLDAFWQWGLSTWDVAAGSLLIKEAGGIASDYKGTEDYLKTGHIICGNPKIFKVLLNTLKPHLPGALL